MNKIDKKVVEAINGLMTKISDESMNFYLKRMKDYLSTSMLESDEKECCNMFDYYGIIEALLSNLELNDYEKGYIFTRFLKYNFSILQDIPYTFVSLDESVKRLSIVGIKNETEVKECLTAYFADKEAYSQKEPQRYELIHELLIEGEPRRQAVVSAYRCLKNYMENPQEVDEKSLQEAMTILDIPDSSMQSFITYQQNSRKPEKKKIEIKKVKKEKVELPKTSKKLLKQRLKDFYDEEEEKNFDYANYNELITILAYLNFPDKHIKKIIDFIFTMAIPNFYYYQYIYQKYAKINPQDPILEQVLSIAMRMMICEEEEYLAYKKDLLILLKQIAHNLSFYNNYSYDYEQLKKVRQKDM